MNAPVIYFDLGNTLVFGPTSNKQPFDDAVTTIEELWWRGYRIGLLSDQNPGTTEQDIRDKLGEYGLEHFRFDVITISSEFDPPVYKPDPQIFETAATKAGHASASSDTVFVTENLSHVEAARDLGWRAIHKPYQTSCTPASGECVEDLDELLALFPQLPLDIYIRDAPGDPGDDQYTGSNFWNSPDLWIRNQEDGGVSHQNPEAGQDNWFYARVHNRGEGIARIFFIYFTVREWAGTQFIYPNDYQPFHIWTAGGFINPGDSKVIHAKWEAAEVPPVGTHACWLAQVHLLATTDSPVEGAHVWEHNNLAQKNLTIVDLIPGESGEILVVLGSRQIEEACYYTIELYRPKNALELPVSVIGQSAKAMGKLVRAGREFVHKALGVVVPREEVGLRFLDAACVELTGVKAGEKGVTLKLESGSTITWSGLAERKALSAARYTPKFAPASLVEEKNGGTAVAFAHGPASGIGIALRPRQIVRTVLRFTVPKDAKPGERFDLDLVQRGEDGRIEGGIAVRVNVQKQRARNPTKPRKKPTTAKTRRKKT
ncbi:MAG: HAD hydrolase-like protein [Gammaproteobacteria bacterium]|nr:HAD hydrolase-like protein [Gammaproteobacteria bacterium]